MPFWRRLQMDDIPGQSKGSLRGRPFRRTHGLQLSVSVGRSATTTSRIGFTLGVLANVKRLLIEGWRSVMVRAN